MNIPNWQLTSLKQPEFLQEVTAAAQLINQMVSLRTTVCSGDELEELLNIILSKTRTITCSDAGSVYLIDNSDGVPKLIFKVSQNYSLKEATFRQFAVPLTANSLAGYVALTGESLNLPDAYDLPDTTPYHLDHSFDVCFSYRTRSVIVMPMHTQNGDIMGVLQLINRKVKPDVAITRDNVLQVTQPYSPAEEEMLRSLLHLGSDD
ncbi:MAG: GAF domain-containing protein [Nostocaceae cyanobacterium]|nr:GAF domain-containing protein [Nostocaceae cyanobacterium]